MINNTFSVTLIVVLIGLNLAAWFHLLKNRRPPIKAGVANDSCFGMPMSAFSNVDHPELLKHHEEVSPLTEAEIYVIYGRKKDAQSALALGVQEGRITSDEAEQFWAKQESVRG